MKQRERQRLLARQCFDEVCLNLNQLVGQFGGFGLQRELSDNFNRQAVSQMYPARLIEGNIEYIGDNYQPETQRAILAPMIDFASQVSGKKTVASSINNAIKAAQRKCGANLFEAAMRLDLTEYLE